MILAAISELSAYLKYEQRVLGLDVGEKTIGIALSDISRTIATPLETIARTKWAKDFALLQKIITQHNIGALIIGYPINMDGSEGPRCQSIRQFAKNIDASLPLPMVLWDERLSTMAVTRTMLEADLSRQRRSELVDKMAASYILQAVLDSMKQGI